MQNLLWALLAPAYPQLSKEVPTGSIARRTGRADLALLNLRLVIEVKFWRESESQQRLIEELAKARSIYLAESTPYEHLICFVWDDGARTAQHEEIRRGIADMGIDHVVIVPRPGDWKRASVADRP